MFAAAAALGVCDWLAGERYCGQKQYRNSIPGEQAGFSVPSDKASSSWLLSKNLVSWREAEVPAPSGVRDFANCNKSKLRTQHRRPL